MKTLLSRSAICAAAILLIPFPTQSAVPLDAVDQALAKVVTFENGQDAAPLNLVEDAVVTSQDSPETREALELRIIRTLESAQTRTARDFLCRQLRTLGTTHCVPVLEAMLTDPESANMARYALQRIGGPAVAQALQRALERTTGDLRLGVLSSLGELGYCQAALQVPNLLRSDNPAEAMAAADCLLKLRNCRWAATELEKARAETRGNVRIHVDNALLACAANLVAEGRVAEARDIYGIYHAPDQPTHLRVAALRGFNVIGGTAGTQALLQGIRDADPGYRANAIALVRTPGDPEVTRTLAEALPLLPPSAQALLIAALGDRGDRAATPQVTVAVASPDEPVRIAALTALGFIGDKGSVRTLISAAATSSGPIQRAARASLLQLAAPGVDQALIGEVSEGNSSHRVEAIRAVAGRQVGSAQGSLFRAARDPEANVRKASVAALGVLVEPSSLPELVGLLLTPAQAGDRSDIESALDTALRRLSEPAAQTAPLLAAWASAPAAARPNLLRLLGIGATTEALAVVRSALDAAPASTLRDAAVRTLADWSSPEAAADLLAIARDSSSSVEKALALRGYVRLAPQTRDSQQMYEQALSLSKTLDERRLVLSGLAAADSFAALDLVLPFLQQDEVRAEAALAAVQIADRTRRLDVDRTKAVLRSIMRTVPTGPAHDRAQQIINDMEKYDGYVLAWEVSGPYSVKGEGARELFDTVLPPEQSDTAGVDWVPLDKGIGNWDVILDDTFGAKDDVAAYVRTGVWVPAAQPARLELGSDDAVKAWVNGTL
ncbi:MAG: HEAT repeat domain-containing protein, partial [Verrucomicrobiae bacterium]|nr:HEAT repeat domain-containing protein [Verrucomicrobiae bacterium]